MPDIATLVLLVLAGLTTQGAEQQSPMSKEIVALQRAVFEARRGEDFIAPSLPRDLALRYLYGRGVEQDVAQGCALLWESRDLAHAPRHDQPAIDIAEGLIDQHCKSLSADQLAEAMTVNACAFIGLQQQVLPLQPGSWIEFSRRGYAIERPSGRVENWFAGDPTCSRQVKMLRTVVLEGADRQVGDLYLVEMLSWQGVRYKGELRRELEWRLFSIGKSSLDVRVQEILLTESGSLWPPPPLPEHFRAGASLSPGRDGEIRWAFHGDPPRRGTIPAR